MYILKELLLESANLIKLGKNKKAEVNYKKILKIDEKNLTALNNLGYLNLTNKKYKIALKYYERVININPNLVEAFNNKANCLKGLKLHNEALDYYDKAIELNPNYISALYNKANCLLEKKDFKKALSIYEEVLALNPNLINAINNKANCLKELGNYSEALICFKKITVINPNYFIAIYNQGVCLKELGKYDEAIKYYDQSLKIKPYFFDAINNKGICLKKLGKYEKALICFKKIYEIDPNFYLGIYNYGNCLKELGRYEEAIKKYDQSLKVKPDFLEALNNKGNCLNELCKFDDAMKCFNKVISIMPNFVDAKFNLGRTQLLNGNFKEGWKNYEARKLCNPTKYKFQNQNKELSSCKNIKHKIIYVHHEQGLGDYIQFCRYFKKLTDLGARVVLDPPKPLINMINKMKINYINLDKTKVSQYDYYVSIASLPLIFNTDLNSIPKETPYLFTPEVLKKKWREKLGTKKRKKIGIKWTGSKNYVDDKYRSTNLKNLINLFDLSLDFHSLEIEYRDDDENLLKNIKNLHCHKKEIVGFDNTAGLIESMDLIITTDTSVAHLSGALGKEVWIMLPLFPDFRWLLKTERTPWYPTAKLYRQTKKDDWKSLLIKVKEDLSLIQ